VLRLLRSAVLIKAAETACQIDLWAKDETPTTAQAMCQVRVRVLQRAMSGHKLPASLVSTYDASVQ
jgi:hypothetical protein